LGILGSDIDVEMFEINVGVDGVDPPKELV